MKQHNQIKPQNDSKKTLGIKQVLQHPFEWWEVLFILFIMILVVITG